MLREPTLKTASANGHCTATFDVINPVTGDTLRTLPQHGPAEVAVAVRRAREAQPAWAALAPKERARMLRRFGTLLLKHQKRVVDTLVGETGKDRRGATVEAVLVDGACDYYGRHAPRWLKSEKRASANPLIYSARLHHRPYGVVGNICPWNYPLLLMMLDMVPALIAGNAVVVKPSEVTPLTAFEVADLLREAGLPDGLFGIVTGDGQTGAALIDEVDYVMFTGSTATGRRVAMQCAERLIPCSLELGGNDPFIVLDDADLNLAAAYAISAGTLNAGQACVAAERVIVEENVYDVFMKQLLKWHKRVTIGTSKKHVMGSLINQREFDRVREHIADAVERGARVVAGGNPLPKLGPLFHDVTILADVTPDMRVMQEETFGPVIPVIKAKNVEDAIRLANDTPYGLSAAVWSNNRQRAFRVAQRLQSGVVNINTVVAGDFGTIALPSGGVKDSGIGRRNGKEGLLKYTQSLGIVRDDHPLPMFDPTLNNRRTVFLMKLNRVLGRVFPFLAP
ncbi:MAG: succinic semialdehyde dehydrogenase [Anaerolineales bacterium]